MHLIYCTITIPSTPLFTWQKPAWIRIEIIAIKGRTPILLWLESRLGMRGSTEQAGIKRGNALL